MNYIYVNDYYSWLKNNEFNLWMMGYIYENV